MKTARYFRIVLCLALAQIFLASSLCFAEDTKLSVQGDSALHAALSSLVGKSVTLQLKGSEPVSGVVEEVGKDAVRIAQLSGKEFYSAIVKLDSVNALVYRAK